MILMQRERRRGDNMRETRWMKHHFHNPHELDWSEKCKDSFHSEDNIESPHIVNGI